MNSKVEKWLTVGALVGWVASMGSLMLLAVRAASPRVALPSLSSPANAENVRSLSPSSSVSQKKSSPFELQPQPPLEAKMPTKPSKSYWLNSLPEVSQPGATSPSAKKSDSRDRTQ